MTRPAPPAGCWPEEEAGCDGGSPPSTPPSQPLPPPPPSAPRKPAAFCFRRPDPRVSVAGELQGSSPPPAGSGQHPAGLLLLPNPRPPATSSTPSSLLKRGPRLSASPAPPCTLGPGLSPALPPPPRFRPKASIGASASRSRTGVGILSACCSFVICVRPSRVKAQRGSSGPGRVNDSSCPASAAAKPVTVGGRRPGPCCCCSVDIRVVRKRSLPRPPAAEAWLVLLPPPSAPTPPLLVPSRPEAGLASAAARSAPALACRDCCSHMYFPYGSVGSVAAQRRSPPGDELATGGAAAVAGCSCCCRPRRCCGRCKTGIALYGLGPAHPLPPGPDG